MTVKEQVLNTGFTFGAYTAEDFIIRARPVIFGALTDDQKHSFIRMAGREQEIFIEAVLKDLGIKIPEVRTWI
jgi:hypothetical protein